MTILAAGLLPSAWLAWNWRAMPQLGIFHDDAIYLVSAKSIAEGHGYRIDSLPETPPQTKYPPLWPVMLAGVWRIAPGFPANLPWLAALVWSFVPAVALLSWRLYRSEAMPPVVAAGLAAIVASSPAVGMASTLLLSELPFVALLLGSLLLTARGAAWASGGLAAAAYLTRSTALPLIVIGPLWFAWRGQRRQALQFGAAMLPAILGWLWWTQANRGAVEPDALTLFYTSYVGYWLGDVRQSGLAAMVWANSAALLEALGHLLSFDASGDFLPSMLARIFALAAISGTIRLVRRGRMRFYAGFAALYSVQLLCWNYPPTARFLLPLLPLAASGVHEEFSTLARMAAAVWNRNRSGDRIAAALAGASMALLIAAAAVNNAHAMLTRLPESYGDYGRIACENMAAIDWIRTRTSPDARVLSYEDPTVYLTTGRRGYSLRVPPGMQKRASRPELERYFRQIPELARSHRIGYALLSLTDYHLDGQEVAWPAYAEAIRRTFEAGVQTKAGGVYAARPSP
jgi:hypothetical protein